MRVLDTWLNAPRRLLLSFVLLLFVPGTALVWLGVRLVNQDRQLEERRLLDRRETAADRFVVALEQTIAGIERRLGSSDSLPFQADDDAVVLNVGPTGTEASPTDRLLYYPDSPSVPPDPIEPFAAGEALEFREGDPSRAAEAYRALAGSPNQAVRAGALLRLARVLRKLGRTGDALRVYADLATLGHSRVLGLPADLVARRARGALLHDLGRADSADEARALFADLIAARWRIDRGTFVAYVEEVRTWMDDAPAIPEDREALSEAAQWVARQRAGTGTSASGRQALRLAGVHVTVLWQVRGDRVVALAAGPRFQEREWFAPARSQVEAQDIEVTTVYPDEDASSGSAVPTLTSPVRRSPAETGLPWVVMAGMDPAGSGPAEFAARRRMLLAGLSLLLVLVVTGGYFVFRAVSRELAVARLQADFVSAVSHEFRTPLTSLQQFSALLTDADEPPPVKRRAFHEAQARGIERLRRLVESLLDFGRMEAGARVYRFAPVDAIALVRRVVADFERDALAAGFSIEWTLPDDAPPVNADSEALARAVWNLLENAAKYSGASRRLFVGVSAQAGRVAISVRDEGLGIPREEQRRIFEKFVRGSASHTHGIKGTGVGLAMVRHIVRAHGGTVRVQSEPGAGSTFTIVLPASRRSEGREREPGGRAERVAR